MENADGIGSCGDVDCEDSLKIVIKVKNNVIEDISFLVAGFVAAVASSSMTTELSKGKTIEEALKITDNDIAIAIALDGLPENKCFLLYWEQRHYEVLLKTISTKLSLKKSL